ncbi:G-protein coupled receptor dmsr-1-like [Calliphora vicina]|uniref:G-protein coupled receptor dmsr-1-like n=1 Tax=Calliphora vicina TaxID=7373 RepID=UPI00325AC55A
MSLNTTQIIYCDKSIDDFHTSYKLIHGYLSLSVCLLGTLANTLNIIVLTRREMRTPTNAILTGLAVADLAVMLEYIPYAVHDYILTERWPREQQLNYTWACYIKFHAIYAQLLHTISIWLTVMLAVWRYLAVTYPQVSREWCGMRNTVLTIILAYVLCGVVVTPWLYLVSSIAQFEEVVNANDKVLHSRPLSEYIVNYQAKHDYANFSKFSTFNGSSSGGSVSDSITSTATSNDTTLERNITVYRLYHSDMALRNSTLRLGTLLIYSVLIKLIPCIALTVLSLRLISALLEVKRRRQMLRNQLIKAEEKSAHSTTMNTLVPPSSAPDGSQMTMVSSSFAIRKKIDKAKQTDRTTQMLLAVLLLFLITEFPQGIMGLLNTILGEAFFMQCYLKLSDLMDVLALLNSSINFILYCSMSRQFRQTFVLLFCPRHLSRCLLSHRHHHHHHHHHQRRHPHDPYGQNRHNQQHNNHQQRHPNNDPNNHHDCDGHNQEMPLQEDNFTVVNGHLATDNRSKSAFIEQWFQTTTQVTQV